MIRRPIAPVEQGVVANPGARGARARIRRSLLVALALSSTAPSVAHAAPLELPIRGITIGPIENARHRDKGYGSPAYGRALVEARRMGATWVSLTPFGRVLDLAPSGVDRSFEAPFEDNRAAVLRAIEQAHDAGLRVLVVPHLWVESGGWRALVDPGSDEGWRRWARAYEDFVVGWAQVAEAGRADLFSVGVEQRSFVTTPRAALYAPILDAVRRVYHGPLTYSANWDDVEDTVILGELDVIGVNAFYPLHHEEGASSSKLREGGERVRAKIDALAARWQRPVLFCEIGYTTRPDPAIRPWEWPDGMKGVRVDEEAQATAYAALVGPLLDSRSFAGFFVWRVYADPDDVSQEAEWGFSPRGKLAELVVRDAFAARWAGDPLAPGDRPARVRARLPFLLDAPSD